MSYAANPNKAKKAKESGEEPSAAEALRQQKQERERIRRVIITLGDDNKKVVGQIKGLVGALEDDVEMHGDLIRQTVLDCAQNLPFKAGIYACWVRRMFDKHPAWANYVPSQAMEEFRTAVRSGQFLHAQLLLRFLVGLGNTGLVSLPDLLQLLNEVLALSQGLRPSKGGDLGVFLVLTSLPFLSKEAYGLATERLDALVAAAGTYLAARDAKWKSLLRVLKGDTPADTLEAVVTTLKCMKEADWKAEAVFHLKGSEPRMEAKDDMPHLTELGISAEDIKKSKVRLQVPLVACRLITATMVADGGEEMSGHDRWLLEDFILLTIEAFGRDVEECSKQLLRFPFMHSMFEATLVETIFSQMLRLPSPPFLPLFYSRLLQAVVDKEQSMLDWVNRGFKTLCGKIPDLDEESFEVLAEAWAYHLINQSYKGDFEPFLGDNVPAQTQRFLRRVLERLQRLSFHQNLVHRLPAAIHSFIPPEPLPATGLPGQVKPEYTRMLGFVRIKDPDTETVQRYCERLLKHQDGDGDAANAVDDEPVPAAENEDDIPDFDDAEEKEPQDKKDEEESAAAKKARLIEEGCVAPPSPGKEPAFPPLPPKDSSEAVEPAKKRQKGTDGQKVEVKVEAKQEVGGLAQAKKEDADFGEAPAEPWPIDEVAEILALAVFQHGAKTPTHMSKILDGHQQVFLKLCPADEDQAHEFVKAIVRSVFGFWRISGQRLEITLETLLQRGIITPRAVVEQALGERTPQASDRMSVWNMINSVARKSLERSQSIRVELAIAKKLEKTDIYEKSKKELEVAIQDTAELFTLIFTELVRSHQDWEDKDTAMRHLAAQRCLMIGRKYHAFIKPLVDTAESRIPGVAHNPEIAEVFQSLRAL